MQGVPIFSLLYTLQYYNEINIISMNNGINSIKVYLL